MLMVKNEHRLFVKPELNRNSMSGHILLTAGIATASAKDDRIQLPGLRERHTQMSIMHVIKFGCIISATVVVF